MVITLFEELVDKNKRQMIAAKKKTTEKTLKNSKMSTFAESKILEKKLKILTDRKKNIVSM